MQCPRFELPLSQQAVLHSLNNVHAQALRFWSSLNKKKRSETHWLCLGNIPPTRGSDPSLNRGPLLITRPMGYFDKNKLILRNVWRLIKIYISGFINLLWYYFILFYVCVVITLKYTTIVTFTFSFDRVFLASSVIIPPELTLDRFQHSAAHCWPSTPDSHVVDRAAVLASAHWSLSITPLPGESLKINR